MKIMKVMRKEQELGIINTSMWDLPTPSSLSYMWNFGSTLGLILILQITSGLMLTTHYTSWAESSFNSVISIMQEVWSGWLIRILHMNGASMFFFMIYLHMFRGMYYFSASNKNLWLSGVVIMILTMGISFLGYVLPWGQMSYWAVAVITNLLSVTPIIGDELVNWVWGAFSVSGPTLTRFYTLHFLLPFILSGLIIIHLVLLHKKGSSNPLGIESNLDKIHFHPYFSIKDILFVLMFMAVMIFMSMIYPFAMGDAINNVPANAMQTPIHIQPEWYFLPSYAILRSLPSKVAGVIALLLSVSIFMLMPLYKMKFSTKFSKQRHFLYWLMISAFIGLMKMGSLPAEEPYILMSKLFSMLYFSSILMLNM